MPAGNFWLASRTAVRRLYSTWHSWLWSPSRQSCTRHSRDRMDTGQASSVRACRDCATVNNPPATLAKIRHAGTRLDDYRTATTAGPLPTDPVLGGDARSQAQQRLSSRLGPATPLIFRLSAESGVTETAGWSAVGCPVDLRPARQARHSDRPVDVLRQCGSPAESSRGPRRGPQSRDRPCPPGQLSSQITKSPDSQGTQPAS